MAWEPCKNGIPSRRLLPLPRRAASSPARSPPRLLRPTTRDPVRERVVALRKRNLSVYDILLALKLLGTERKGRVMNLVADTASRPRTNLPLAFGTESEPLSGPSQAHCEKFLGPAPVIS